MIEIIEGLPPNVLGIVVRGRVRNHDCSEILAPALERARDQHYRLRLYYEIRSRYPGATWDEMSLGIGNDPRWEQVAIVSDVAWVRYTVRALRLLMPGEIRVFPTKQIPEALTWITDTKQRPRWSVPAPMMTSQNPGVRAVQPAPQFLYSAP